MALSKRTRFEVFKRDKFTCQYCGRTPPTVILHADHIVASSTGGSDSKDNLITSCADCNLGKSNVSLECVPAALADRAAEIAERHEQVQAYNRLLKKIAKDKAADAESINQAFKVHYPDRMLSETFMKVSVKRFLEHLPVETVREAMELACLRMPNADGACKYFCGICWRQIKGDREGGRNG